MTGGRAHAFDHIARERAEVGRRAHDGEEARLQAGDVEQRGEELRETVSVADDRRGVGLEHLGIALAGGEVPQQQLSVAPDHGDGRLEIVRGHAEDVLAQPLELALPGDVAEHDHAALRAHLRSPHYRRAYVQHAPTLRAQLDIALRDALARAKRLGYRNEGGGDFARARRPLRQALLLERLTDDQARIVKPQELPRRPIELDDRAAGVDDDEGVGHRREDRLELQGAPLVLARHVFRSTQALDYGSGLRGDPAEALEVGIVVGFRLIALRGQHAEHTLIQEDRNDDARLRRLQLLRFGAVKQAHRRSISVPAPDQLRRRRPDHLTGETLAKRERATGVLDATVHLAHDVHGLARLFVCGEKKDRGIHCACGLVVERTE